MPWNSFELKLTGAYALVDKIQGWSVYNDKTKLQKLQNFQIKAKFFTNTKETINTQALVPGSATTFDVVMEIYQTRVQKSVPKPTKWWTAILEVNQDQGGNLIKVKPTLPEPMY